MITTVPGIGPGSWDAGKLAREQEQSAQTPDTQAIVYRLYTEAKDTLADIVSRYFAGATFTFTVGLWQGTPEDSTVIEIIGTRADMQSIAHLAGDIRLANNQTSVLVTWHPISRLDVTA